MVDKTAASDTHIVCDMATMEEKLQEFVLQFVEENDRLCEEQNVSQRNPNAAASTSSAASAASPLAVIV